jgi:hypothetical protein
VYCPLAGSGSILRRVVTNAKGHVALEPHAAPAPVYSRHGTLDPLCSRPQTREGLVKKPHCTSARAPSYCRAGKLDILEMAMELRLVVRGGLVSCSLARVATTHSTITSTSSCRLSVRRDRKVYSKMNIRALLKCPAQPRACRTLARQRASGWSGLDSDAPGVFAVIMSAKKNMPATGPTDNNAVNTSVTTPSTPPVFGQILGLTTARVKVVQLFPFNLHPGLSHFDCGRLHHPRDLPGALVLLVENLDVDMLDVATDVATNVEVPTLSVDDIGVVSNNLVGDEDVTGAANVTDDNNPTAQPAAVVALLLDLFAPARLSHTHLPHGRVSSTSSPSHSSQRLSNRFRRYHHCCQTQQRPSSAVRRI